MIMTEVLKLQNKPMEGEKKTRQKLSRRRWAALVLIFLVFAIGAVVVSNLAGQKFSPPFMPALFPQAKKKSFSEKFSKRIKKRIEETGRMSESSDNNWWVNSGGWMDISGGTGKTALGDLAEGNDWREIYDRNNPEDTDDGVHPQNIFRLVTRSKWENFRQEAYFRIKKINLSDSDNRNESNGILLFNRYQNGDNLYYTGLRVDGYAVIKKKIDGEYHTLSQERIFQGDEYDRVSNPNLLPLNRWIGLRSEVQTKRSGDVEIKVYYRLGRNLTKKDWKLAVQYVDKGQKGDKIKSEGYGGVRTDFMDVEIDKYKIREL